jgi:hypothetical protein
MEKATCRLGRFDSLFHISDRIRADLKEVECTIVKQLSIVAKVTAGR